jgi:SAM-dependent methyltransferase
VVTCAQSFHWMEPEATIAEIARILRPGGIFAAYDFDWPPLIDWEVDVAFLRVIEASGVDPGGPEKAQHVERLAASRRFRTVRGLFMHARTRDIGQLPLRSGRSPAA